MRTGIKGAQWSILIILLAIIIGDLILLRVRGTGLLDYESKIGLAQMIDLIVLIALVVVTAYYADSAKTQADASLKMAREMERARIEAVRPSLSLWPADYTLGGSFSTLSLRNSGGVAKDVKIDFKVTNPNISESLFIPAIDRESMVILPLASKVQDTGGKISVEVTFKDSYNRDLSEKLEINFHDLKQENRKLAFQTSLIGHKLHDIERDLNNIGREISRVKSH